MLWRRRAHPFQRRKVEELRWKARIDPAFDRLLAVELLNEATELVALGSHSTVVRVAEEMESLLRPPARSATGRPDRLLATGLGLAGVSHAQLGHVAEAERYLMESLEMHRAASSDTSPDALTIAPLLLSLADCRSRVGDLPGATGLAEEVLLVTGHAGSAGDVLVAELQEQASAMLARLG